MNEIVSSLNQIAEAIKGDWISIVISIVSTIATIVLTCLSIWLTCRMDKQNKQLQILISNRDNQNQTRQIVVDIYNAYLDAFYYVGRLENAVADIFVSDQSYLTWAKEIEQKRKDLTYAYNKAILLFDDNELTDCLGKGLDAFSAIKNITDTYITLGLANQTIINAWNNFCINHPSIQAGDYLSLLQNPVWGDEFRKMCSNSYTESIQDAIGKFMSIVACDEFDDKFKSYVKIEKIKED